jgi:hypothetical protein
MRRIPGDRINRGWYGLQLARHRGRNQKAAQRAFLAYGEAFTTTDLMRFVFPRLDARRQPRWRWRAAREAAERFAVRATPRTRPLRWVAKPGLYKSTARQGAQGD